MRTTMATENNNKTLNVPNLRFPEFSGEWTKTLLNNYLEENKERNKRGIFTKNHVLSVSGDFGIVNQIELLGRSFAGKSVLDYHVVRTGNIVYTKSPLKEYPYGIVKVNGGVDGIVSTLYAVYKVKETANGKFVEYYFGLPNRTNRYFKPIVRIGAKHDMKIGNDEVLANYVVFPCVDEQKRISDFICLLDERIATQIKIIEKLESLIKGLCQVLFSFEEYATYLLGDICSITTGKLDANAMVEGGKYPFFTCAEEVFSIDNYAFDTEALLISGNGANLGYIHYYNGKFNAYQRTYVLDKFTIDINYIRLYLETFLKNRIEQEKNIGNTPYIVLGTLSKMKIRVPDIITQQKIVKSMTSLKKKLSNERLALIKYEEQKKYLLSNLFI